MIVFIYRLVLIDTNKDYGESMKITNEDKYNVIVNNVTKINRFDIIVFDAPDVDDSYYIKRVIGLPGDQIEMKNDVLYINDEAMEEPYLTESKEDRDRQSTRLNSSHVANSYAVFCLKKKR